MYIRVYIPYVRIAVTVNSSGVAWGDGGVGRGGGYKSTLYSVRPYAQIAFLGLNILGCVVEGWGWEK